MYIAPIARSNAPSPYDPFATLFSEKDSHCFEQQRFQHREWNWCGAKDPIAGGDVNDCVISLPNGSRIYILGQVRKSER
jgi:hypothetical protein